MRLNSTTILPDGKIPKRCAFGIPDAEEHLKLGDNNNPQLSWSGIPAEAKSLVLLCVDPDVPSSMDDFNQEGRTISIDLPRVDFFHWVMTDIRPEDGGVIEGECSKDITTGGKINPPGPPGSRQGINDYTGFMAGDPEMKGDYFGYDGPCPPWNDERLHRYHFILYATDLETCPVDGTFTGADVRQAIEGHILDEARLTGTYSLNPAINSPD
jgi:hypothetical protein